jgi:hypothetical protein
MTVLQNILNRFNCYEIRSNVLPINDLDYNNNLLELTTYIHRIKITLT